MSHLKTWLCFIFALCSYIGVKRLLSIEGGLGWLEAADGIYWGGITLLTHWLSNLHPVCHSEKEKR